MTRDEVLALKPGRELDVLAGTEIMGLEYIPASSPSAGLIVQDHFFDPKTGDALFGWSPSTDIAAAFEAETKVIEKDPSMYVHALASVVFGYSQVQDISDIRKMCMLIHATPEQRCKAALLAVMEGEKDD